MVITAASRLRMGLSPQDVADETGLSLTLVYRLLAAGEIPHRRFGRRIVVGREALSAYLNGREKAAASVDIAAA